MTKMKLWMMAAILFCGIAGMVSCNGKSDETTKETTKDSVAVENNGPLVAVERYLVDSIGSQYAPGEVCIPCVMVVTNEVWHGDSARVLGDFWVFNYNIAGDTLKCVSGGSHPGKMLLLPDDGDNYVVASFDQVEDGSKNIESAKRIFGNMFEAFSKINSDEKKREEVRAKTISDYVKANNLPVKYYQDYGWPAKEIPAQSAEIKN